MFLDGKVGQPSVAAFFLLWCKPSAKNNRRGPAAMEKDPVELEILIFG